VPPRAPNMRGTVCKMYVILSPFNQN